MISEHYQRIKQVILINKQVRRYYGKKYYRQASAGESGGTQTRLSINQARASQSRFSEGEARVAKSQETEIMAII